MPLPTDELDEDILFRSREQSDDNFLRAGSVSLLTESVRQQCTPNRIAIRRSTDSVLNLNNASRRVPDAVDNDANDENDRRRRDIPHDSDDSYQRINGGNGEATMASLTDKSLAQRLASFQGELKSLNLVNATSLQGLFLDTVPTSLKYMDLTGCRSIKNEFFTSFISKFFNLENLFLVGCEDLQDDALDAVVTFCPRLEGIAVPPDTTDAGLAALARSASIKRVGIRSCHHVTLDGIRFLLRSKPDLERVVVNKCLQVSPVQVRECCMNDDDGSDVLLGSPTELPAPSERRRSLNMDIMKEFITSSGIEDE